MLPLSVVFRRWCLLFVVCWGGVLAAPAWASHPWDRGHDHITERHWVEDPSAQWSLDEARKASVQAFAGVLSRGFGPSVIWLRLHLDPQSHAPGRIQPERLVLRIRPVYLDRIDIYDPSVSNLPVATVGDRLHPRADELQGLDFMAPIERGTAARDIWVRLESTSTRQIHVQAFSFDDIERLSRLQQLVFSSYVGLILVFVAWGLMAAIFSREWLLWAFTLKQSAALGFALVSLGFLRSVWPESWSALRVDELGTFFSISAVSTAVLFHVLFTRECGVPPWVTRVHLVMLALFPVKMVLLALGWEREALELNMHEVMLIPPVFLASAWLARGWEASSGRRPALSRPVVVGFYAITWAVILMAAMPGLGLSAGGEVALYIVQTHGLLTAFMILLMLQFRNHVRRKQQQETLVVLERTRMQVQQERDIREEHEKLLDMLAHELKTPLATMHMRLDARSPGGQEVTRAIREMTAVIDRCVQASQIGDRKLQPDIRACSVTDVLKDAVASCSQPARIHMEMPSHCLMETDSQLLFIVLSNLLENACKYAAEGSEIRLQVERVDGPACVRISLSNLPGHAGWPQPDRLFQKYYRSPQARRHSGTGLGLYLVKHLVSLLGGHIVYAPDEQHVRFVVELPVRARAEREPALSLA